MLSALGISIGLSNSLIIGEEKIGNFIGLVSVGFSHAKVLKVEKIFKNIFEKANYFQKILHIEINIFWKISNQNTDDNDDLKKILNKHKVLTVALIYFLNMV